MPSAAANRRLALSSGRRPEKKGRAIRSRNGSSLTGSDIDKATGVGTGIAVGTKVYWDVADQQAKADDESGANKYLGKTIAAAGDDDTKVRVRLGQ